MPQFNHKASGLSSCRLSMNHSGKEEINQDQACKGDPPPDGQPEKEGGQMREWQTREEETNAPDLHVICSTGG